MAQLNSGDEQWRDVRGFEGLYRVSNTGRVASLPIPKGRGMRARKGRELKAWCGKNGQPCVDFTVHGERSRFLVSRLVADAFLHRLREEDCVYHENLDKKDNRLCNLAVISYAEVCRRTRESLCDFVFVPRDAMTADIANEYLEYRDGLIFWKKSPTFQNKIGDEVGFLQDGHWKLHLCGNTYTRNQIVYLMHHGEAADYVLPRNGDYLDSHINNLYAATASQWATISGRVNNTVKDALSAG